MSNAIAGLYPRLPMTCVFTLPIVTGSGVKVGGVHTGTAADTVTVLDAVSAPSAVVTVMVAVPGATGVTIPVELTVATAVLLELHITAGFVASLGDTVACNWAVAPPAVKDKVFG